MGSHKGIDEMMRLGPVRLFIVITIASTLLSACAGGFSSAAADGKLRVVATTTIVGDVVQQVGGNFITLSALIPPNVDEHGYEPTPQDAAKIAQADLVFMNGAGLETFINKLMKNASGKAPLISVSDGIQLLQGPAEEEVQANGTGAGATRGDPHIWMDPNNVLTWVDNIQKALTAADPKHAADYQKNAAQYRQQLKGLDGTIREQVSQIPNERRKLVTDHLIFTYFAKRYNFDQVGAVVPGYSTLSAPSAQELAGLEDQIRKLGVPVIFVGNTVNPALSERVAQDTQTKLIHILTGSLTDKNGPAPTYLAYMKYNLTAIVSALK